MNLFDIFFVIICGIGALNSFLFSAYLFFNKKGNSKLNKIFSLFILTFSLKVAKTVWIFFFDSIHPFYHSVWYISFALLPILYTLYFYNIVSKSDKNNRLVNNISIAAATLFLILIPLLIYSYEMLVFKSIMVLNILTIIYVGKLLLNSRANFPNDALLSRWFKTLYAFILIIFTDYLLFLFFNYNFLHIEAFIFSLFVYYLVYLEITENFFGKVHKQKKEVDFINKKVIDKLNMLMEYEKTYRDPQISLSSLAKSLNITSHQLSRLVNESFDINFNDYINRYRIEEAKSMFADPENQNVKISYVALECGFNSISVFNTAFKKFTKQTPSQYQTQIKA